MINIEQLNQLAKELAALLKALTGYAAKLAGRGIGNVEDRALFLSNQLSQLADLQQTLDDLMPKAEAYVGSKTGSIAPDSRQPLSWKPTSLVKSSLLFLIDKVLTQVPNKIAKTKKMTQTILEDINKDCPKYIFFKSRQKRWNKYQVFVVKQIKPIIKMNAAVAKILRESGLSMKNTQVGLEEKEKRKRVGAQYSVSNPHNMFCSSSPNGVLNNEATCSSRNSYASAVPNASNASAVPNASNASAVPNASNASAVPNASNTSNAYPYPIRRVSTVADLEAGINQGGFFCCWPRFCGQPDAAQQALLQDPVAENEIGPYDLGDDRMEALDKSDKTCCGCFRLS